MRQNPSSLPIKRVTRLKLNFKAFRSADSVLTSIKLMHMIRKGQFTSYVIEGISSADKLSTLAGIALPV